MLDSAVDAIVSGVNIFLSGRNFARLMEGLWVTLEISVISVALSMLLGIFAGLLMTSKNRLLLAGTRLYLEAIRVIPILVLLFLFYYSLSRLWGINLSAMSVAVLVFTLWGTAEMADLVRGAITSMPAPP